MDSMTKVEKIIMIMVAVIVSLGLVLSQFNETFFRQYFIIEDGPVEWLTVIALMASAILCFSRVASMQQNYTSKYPVLTTLLLGCIFLFGAGEEISWGQRIFDIQTTDFFQQYNKQQEMNLHNLVIGGVKVNKLVFGKILTICVLLYLLVLTPLYHKNARIADWIDARAIPMPRKYLVIAYASLFLAVELLGGARKGELMEFGGASLFFILLYNPFNIHVFPTGRRTRFE